MSAAKATYIHAYTADGQCLGTIALTAIMDSITKGYIMAYGYVAWLSGSVGDCLYMSSSDHVRIYATIVGMVGWFSYAGRNCGDKAPQRLIDALNGELTLPGGSAPVADKCTCGTSRTPSGGRHNDYCDGFPGRGCRGIVDGSRRCSCCV